MLAKSEVVPGFVGTILTVENIKADKLPPPETPPPPPEQQSERQNIDRPDILVPNQNTVSTTTLPPSLPGSGAATLPTLPPLIPPVEVEASIVRGVELQPAYPPSLARQEIEGVVTVRVLIGTDGRVKEVQQVSATDPEFFRATQRQALRHWRFKPATRDGIAVESWRQMTVRFKLEA